MAHREKKWNGPSATTDRLCTYCVYIGRWTYSKRDITKTARGQTSYSSEASQTTVEQKHAPEASLNGDLGTPCPLKPCGSPKKESRFWSTHSRGSAPQGKQKDALRTHIHTRYNFRAYFLRNKGSTHNGKGSFRKASSWYIPIDASIDVCLYPPRCRDNQLGSPSQGGCYLSASYTVRRLVFYFCMDCFSRPSSTMLFIIHTVPGTKYIIFCIPGTALPPPIKVDNDNQRPRHHQRAK